MKQKISVNECKKLQFGILKYIDEFCRKNDISYFMGYGTLLGAVRHGGFIPWDDDIDLLMPRPDLNRLISEMQMSGVYTLMSSENKRDYYYPYIKIGVPNTILNEEKMEIPISDYGINIDIFPLDGMPNGVGRRKRFYKKVCSLKQMWIFAISSQCASSQNPVKYMFKYIVWSVARLVGWRYWLNKYEKLCRKYDYESSEYVAPLCGGDGAHELFPKKWFEPVDMKFEGENFSAPRGHAEYLRIVYGDYWQLPPEKDRVLAHPSDAYVIEEK